MTTKEEKLIALLAFSTTEEGFEKAKEYFGELNDDLIDYNSWDKLPHLIPYVKEFTKCFGVKMLKSQKNLWIIGAVELREACGEIGVVLVGLAKKKYDADKSTFTISHPRAIVKLVQSVAGSYRVDKTDDITEEYKE
jgi:hypothetical protein